MVKMNQFKKNGVKKECRSKSVGHNSKSVN